jgi:hypothetical protein
MIYCLASLNKPAHTTEGRDRPWVGALAPSRGEGRARPVGTGQGVLL